MSYLENFLMWSFLGGEAQAHAAPFQKVLPPSGPPQQSAPQWTHLKRLTPEVKFPFLHTHAHTKRVMWLYFLLFPQKSLLQDWGGREVWASSEEKALTALPQALGVGSHCTPSAEKGIFIALLTHVQHLVPRWEVGWNAKTSTLLLKCGLFPYPIRNIPVRFLLRHTKWRQVAGRCPTAACRAMWTYLHTKKTYTCSKSGIFLKKEFFLTPSSALSGKMGAGSAAQLFLVFLQHSA